MMEQGKAKKPGQIFCIPKGDLEESAMSAISARIGPIEKPSRMLWVWHEGAGLHFLWLRPTEILTYVARGEIGAGFVGRDTMVERIIDDPEVANDIVELFDTGSSRVRGQSARWVLAVPADSQIQCIDDLRGLDRPLKVCTEIPAITSRWGRENGISLIVEKSLGSTEAKAPQFCDAVVDCTHSGATLRENGLRIIADVFSSTSILIVNRKIIDSSQNLAIFCNSISSTSLSLP